MRLHGRWTSRLAYPALVLLFLVVDCATSFPTGRFDALSEASRSTLDASTAMYARVEGLKRQYMVFNPAEGRLTLESFKPIVRDDQGQMRDFNLAPRLRFRESALEVLSHYADTLQAFAKKDYQGDLDKATQKLHSSIGDLVASFGGNADAQKAVGILATAVNELGRTVVEGERRETLRKAMAQAQPGVAEPASLVVADNALIAQGVTIMRSGILRAANGMRPPDPSPARLTLDEQVSRAITGSNEILGSLDSLSPTVKAIPAAHAEFQESLDKKELSVNQLQSLIAEAERLNKFYRSLE
jgi:hypothetical protein